jgi:hypothetical protein
LASPGEPAAVRRPQRVVAAAARNGGREPIGALLTQIAGDTVGVDRPVDALARSPTALVLLVCLPAVLRHLH